VNADSPEALVVAIEAEYRLKVNPTTCLTEVRHAYTHFTLTEFPWRCELVQQTNSESLRWVALNELGDYPMGKIDRTISSQI